MEPFTACGGLTAWKTLELGARSQGLIRIGMKLVQIVRICNANDTANQYKRERRKSKCIEP